MLGLFGRAGLGQHGGMATGAGWTWAQTAVLLAGLISVAGAAISVALTYGLNQRAARRERHSRVFAEALTAIEDYAEMPYRIRRRPRDLTAQHELTEQISQIQSRIAFHQAWLWIEAPSVAGPYAELVRATKAQAGTQMREAWLKPAARKAAEFNLAVAYDRDKINAARSQCVDAMRDALGRRHLPSTPRHARHAQRARHAQPGQHYSWPFSPSMICFALEAFHEASGVFPNSSARPFGNFISGSLSSFPAEPADRLLGTRSAGHWRNTGQERSTAGTPGNRTARSQDSISLSSSAISAFRAFLATRTTFR